MDLFLTGDYQGEPFKVFSTVHIITIAIIIIMNILVIIWLKKKNNPVINKYFRYILGLILIFSELLYEVWSIWSGTWSIDIYLPLHLCDISIIFSAIILFNKNFSLYEITYFIGLGGSMQAIITPDLYPYSFPHIMFFIFFISHGGIITAVLYMTFIEKYRPVLKSILKTFVFLNIYMVIIAGINLLTNGNYLFICSKPLNPSLLDYLGPWPWYIAVLEVVSVAIFFIYYVPFAIKDTFKNNSGLLKT